MFFSAKIYGFRVDALHTETQKLSGNILNNEEGSTDENRQENPVDGVLETPDAEQTESKKPARRLKAKITSFIATELSKITLEHEFEFRPLQPPNMCQWRGGIGKDSVYAEMVSSTMYSSSDYALIDGFTNANSRPEEQQVKIESILEHTTSKMVDLTSLRDVIRTNEMHDHILGNPTLRDFSFNETASNSFIDTIHESCLEQIDESINKSSVNNDDVDHYDHDELVHAAIDDLTDDYSHSNEVFKHALTELSQQDPSTMHSNLGNYQSQTTANTLPIPDEILSASFMSTISFVDQMPNLLHAKELQSEYSYFDATKLKLFAGPNIWKYTNLLHSNQKANQQPSIIQQQQAPAHRHRISTDEPHVPKRSFRIDLFNQMSFEQIISNSHVNREKKPIGISQSALVLRVREKSFNQMQLARKLRPLTDLTNSHNFPQLNFESLHSMNRRREQANTEAEARFNHDDDGDDHRQFHMTLEHHDDDG